MGRLEELAREKGYNSLREVGWKITPEKGEHKPAYIANKVRDLDRGKDLPWWTGTGKKYWQALSELLEVRESELLETVQQAGSADVRSDAQNLWVFEMFPGLRPLDLASERLFPGLPTELTRRGGPQVRNTWWVAAGGAGKTLLGRWLEVNFGWTAVKARTWAEAAAELPESGRVYLELDSADGAPVNPDQILSPDLRLCIAVAAEPPVEASAPRRRRQWRAWEIADREQTRDATCHWSTVRSPEAHEWLLPLIDWVTARLRRPEGFIPDEVRAMVADASIAEIVATPGEALDLFGVIDEVGIEAKGRKRGEVDPLRWAKAWVNAAAERADRAVPRGMEAHLRKHGIDVLLAATKRRIRDGLAGELSRSQWLKIIPEERAAGADYSDIYQLAERGDLKALEEIKLRLRPDRASWVAAFEGIRLVVEADHGLVVRPEWMARVLEGAAFEALFENAPDGVGALLLHGDTAEQALDRLVAAFSSGDYTIAERAMMSADVASPEALALLDGAVRAGGLCAAGLPVDLAGRLWERAMEFTEERWPNLPPVPILGVPALDHWRGKTSLGAWFLAMLALSQRAGRTSRPMSALDPWSGVTATNESERLLEALSRAEMAGRATQEHPEDVALAALGRRLGSSLLDCLGILRHHNHVISFQVADLVVSMAAGADPALSEEERRNALRLGCGLHALAQACDTRGQKLADVLVWCWRTWASEQDHDWPPYSWVHQQAGGASAQKDVVAIWALLPSELVNEGLYKRIVHLPAIWGTITAPVWERWLSVWADKEHHWGEADGVFQFIPEELAVRAVVDGQVDPWCHEVRRILWARMSDRLVQVADELALQPPRAHPKLPHHGGPLADLVWSAPDEHVEGFIGRARAWLAEPEQYRGGGDWVWRWLLSVVEGRRPGWREAFALLSERRRAASPISGQR